MPIDSTGFLGFEFLTLAFVIKIFLALLLVFYVFFALIIFRQIQLMAKALPMYLSPFLKFLGILHIGLALALFFAFIEFF